MGDGGAFTGVWDLCKDQSQLTGPSPLRWIQTVAPSRDEVTVREEVEFEGGAGWEGHVVAAFDGRDYPVTGYPAFDTIAYIRLDGLSISGTGKKNGVSH